MKLLVLSRNRFLYSSRRLVKAGRLRGHEVEVANPLAAHVTVHARSPISFHEPDSTIQPAVDLVMPRIGYSITDYGLAIVRQYEMMGIPVLNRAEAIGRARDKVHALQALVSAGLPIPPTVLMRSAAHVEAAVDAVGGLPVVVKTFKGTQGVGVMLLNSLASLRSILDMMGSMGQDILMQRFIQEASGRDVRVFVVGGKAVAAMRRESDGEEEFRSNLHRGGKGEAVDLDPQFERVAQRAVAALGLDIAGVDILETSAGPMIVEVNAAPGLEGIEGATQVDVADAMIEHGEQLVAQATTRTADHEPSPVASAIEPPLAAPLASSFRALHD